MRLGFTSNVGDGGGLVTKAAVVAVNLSLDGERRPHRTGGDGQSGQDAESEEHHKLGHFWFFNFTERENENEMCE